MKVYLHMKKPKGSSYYLGYSSPILVNIYFNKKDAVKAATPKNPNGTSYDHFVVIKTIK